MNSKVAFFTSLSVSAIGLFVTGVVFQNEFFQNELWMFIYPLGIFIIAIVLANTAMDKAENDRFISVELAANARQVGIIGLITAIVVFFGVIIFINAMKGQIQSTYSDSLNESLKSIESVLG